MFNFVISTKPKSFNSKDRQKAEAYRNKLQLAFAATHPIHKLLTEELYGVVYHFFRTDIGIDADNISKPVWDALRGIAYEDDKQIKMRIAGSFDLTAYPITILDFSGLSGATIDTLLENIHNQDHVLYVEFGKFTTDMVRLNLEINGN